MKFQKCLIYLCLIIAALFGSNSCQNGGSRCKRNRINRECVIGNERSCCSGNDNCCRFTNPLFGRCVRVEPTDLGRSQCAE